MFELSGLEVKGCTAPQRPKTFIQISSKKTKREEEKEEEREEEVGGEEEEGEGGGGGGGGWRGRKDTVMRESEVRREVLEDQHDWLVVLLSIFDMFSNLHFNIKN